MLGEIHQFFIGDEKITLEDFILVAVVIFEESNVCLQFFLVDEHAFEDPLDVSFDHTEKHDLAACECLFLRLFF